MYTFPRIYNCEDFFVARPCGAQTIPALPTPKCEVGGFPLNPVKNHEVDRIRQATVSVGSDWDGNPRLRQRDKELWSFPIDIKVLIGKVRFSHLGIKFAEAHNKGYHWQHGVVIALASPDNVNAFELTPQRAEERYHGYDVYSQIASVTDGALVTFQHQPTDLVKRIGSRLKNSCPHELVHDEGPFIGNT